MLLNFSEPCNELFASLAKAQGEIEPITKNREVKVKMKSGGQYSYSYATLANVIDTIKKPLSKNGITFVQLPKVENNVLSMTTLVTHSSGQYISHVYSLPLGARDAQGIGGIITYSRRYALQSIFGLAADEDDDANGALENNTSYERPPRQQNKTSTPAPPPPPTNAPKLATKKQVGMYKGKLREAYGIEASKQKDAEFKKKFGVDSANDFTSEQVSKLIDGLINLIEKQGAFNESAPKQQNIGFGKPNFSK